MTLDNVCGSALDSEVARLSEKDLEAALAEGGSLSPAFAQEDTLLFKQGTSGFTGRHLGVAGGDPSTQGGEMMAHVGDVVLDEEAEGEGSSGDGALVPEAGRRDVADGPDEVFVEGEPEGENLGPLAFAVVLEADPGVLGVAGHGLGGDLQADDAAEVVDGGVGEVADDLFGGPFAFALGEAGVGVGEGDEPGDAAAKGGGEALAELGGVEESRVGWPGVGYAHAKAP